MQLLIKRMKIENFKGIKDLEIQFAPGRTDISGVNGSGKTSIPDAYNWLMYNKDSRGNAPGSDTFSEKPLDKDGQQIHHIDTAVEIDALLDGEKFSLKRVQIENWVKRRGAAEDAQYAGNVSAYYINGVEVKQVEFKKRIAEIVPEEVSRLVSTLSAFNAVEWKKRRKILLDMSGVDADAVLMQKAQYEPIAQYTAENNISVEDMRKVFTERKRNLESDLKTLPVRVDEATKALPAHTEYDIANLKQQEEAKKGEIATIDAQIINAKSNDPREARKAGIRTLHDTRAEKERAVKERYMKRVDTAAKATGEAKRELETLETAKDRLHNSLSILTRQADTVITYVNDWREKYRNAYKNSFTFEEAGTCQACGQELSAEIVEARKGAAEEKFNKERAAELERISAQGKLESEKLEHLKKQIAETEEEIKALGKRKEAAEDAAEAASLAFKEATKKTLNAEIESDTELQDIEQKINQLLEGPDTGADAIESKIAELNEQKDALQDELFQIGAALQAIKATETTKKRIAELQAEITKAGQALNSVEQTLALIEQFIQDRCGTLEASINGMFPTLRWKLFDTQINGGITETCQCMIPCPAGLVPYESANTAAQIAADVEIVNVFGEHYNARMPLFVDNSERLNHIAPADTQLITLTVTKDKGLKVTHL